VKTNIPFPNQIIRNLVSNKAGGSVIFASLLLAVGIAIFAGPAQLINAIVGGGIWALLAVGLALIFGVANVSYFAHGESFMIGAYISYFIYTPLHNYIQTNPNPFLSAIAPFAGIISATVVGFFMGILIEKFLFYPLRIRTKPGEWVMNAFLLTLGISIILSNGAMLLLGASFRGIPSYWDVEPISIVNVRVPVDRFISLLIALVTIGLLWLFLKNSKIGRAIRAVSQDETGAELVGIDLNKIYQLTMGLATATATLAGASLLSIFQAYPTVGLIPLYFAWYVVILAGLGNIAGAIAGGFIVALLQTVTQVYIGISWANVVPIFAMIIILIITPSGIFGSEVKGIQER